MNLQQLKAMGMGKGKRTRVKTAELVGSSNPRLGKKLVECHKEGIRSKRTIKKDVGWLGNYQGQAVPDWSLL